MALLDYRYQVRGNSKEDTWTLERKLNRNWYMAKEVREDKENKLIIKKFGALTIIYDTYLEMIIGITNHKYGHYDNEIDENLKANLNRLYGIK